MMIPPPQFPDEMRCRRAHSPRFGLLLTAPSGAALGYHRRPDRQQGRRAAREIRRRPLAGLRFRLECGSSAGLRNTWRSRWRVVHGKAEAVDSVIGVERARDGAGGWNAADFSHSLCPVASYLIRDFDQDDVDGWHVASPQDAEVAQEQRVWPSVRGGEVFRERVTQPHVDPAFHLFGAQARIDGMADIVSSNDALEPAILAKDYHLCGIAEGQMSRRVFQGSWRARFGGEITDVIPRVFAADQLLKRRVFEIGSQTACGPLRCGATQRGRTRCPGLPALRSEVFVPADRRVF